MEIKRLVSGNLSSNVFIIKKDYERLIIDSGADLESVKKEVGKNKVLALLLTHGHYDHAMYALDYAKEYGCKIYASVEAAAELVDPAKNYGETFKIDHFEDFVFLKGDGSLKLGSFEIEYISTQGHCKSCNCFKIDDQLFAGDTLFENGIGRTDLFGSSKSDMIKSLEKLDEQNFAFCHSGHGDSTDCLRQKRNIKAYLRFLKR